VIIRGVAALELDVVIMKMVEYVLIPTNQTLTS